MQIRAGLFPPQTTFYNAGGGVSRIGHFRQFLAGLSPKQQPKFLLIGLDQWFFNARTQAYPEASFANQVGECGNVLNVVQSSWIAIYGDLGRGRYGLAAGRNPANIGLNARVQSNGFRNDGSYFYGRVTADPNNPDALEDFHARETYRRIAQGTGRFEHADSADPKLVAELGLFLDEARRRGIHVLGFLPPFEPEVNDVMTSSGNYRYISSLYSTLKPVFEKRGFVLVDQSDIRDLGIDDSGFIDGVHASERAHVRMLQVMLQADPVLGSYTNSDYLDGLWQRSHNPLVLATDRLR
jgi:hypothetical protein